MSNNSAPNTYNVTIEAFSMALPFCGFKEYVSRLGYGIAARAKELREKYGIRFRFVVPKEYEGCFGDEVEYFVTADSQRKTIEANPDWTADLYHMPTQHIRFRHMKRAAHTILTIHDVNFMHNKGRVSRFLHKLRLNSRINNATHLAFITEFAAEDTLHLYNLDKPYRVIHNGVTNINTIEQKPVEGIEPGYLFHLSSLMVNKRPELLIDMMKALPDQRLVIAGNTKNAPHLIQMVENNSQITLLNQIDEQEKAWLYANCNAFLFPSECEGFGMPPIEAMTMGKPVVMSRLTSLPEVGASVAYYWDEYTPEGMAHTINKALSDYNSNRDENEARIKANAARFTWDKCIDSYIEYYMDVLGIER